MMMSKEKYKVFYVYEEAFGVKVPMPYPIEDEVVRIQVVKALKEGKPIADDYNWYQNIPDDAVA